MTIDDPVQEDVMRRSIKGRPQHQELLSVMIRFPHQFSPESKLERRQARTLLVLRWLNAGADQLPGHLLNNYFISDLAVLTINLGTKESNGSKFFGAGENSGAAVCLSNPRCSTTTQSSPGLTRGIEHSQLDLLLLLQIPPGPKPDTWS